MSTQLAGMTHVQTRAFRRIQALKTEFAHNASHWNVADMEKIADECERLIKRHFPQDWRTGRQKALDKAGSIR